MDQLNLENAEKYADENEEVLQAWLDQIVDGTIELEDGTSPTATIETVADEPPPPPAKKSGNARRKREL